MYTAIGLTSGAAMAAAGLVNWWVLPVMTLGWLWLDLAAADEDDE